MHRFGTLQGGFGGRDLRSRGITDCPVTAIRLPVVTDRMVLTCDIRLRSAAVSDGRRSALIRVIRAFLSRACRLRWSQPWPSLWP